MRISGLSDRAIPLAIAGILGVLLSAGLAMSLFLHYVSISALIAFVIYIFGVFALTLVTAGRGRLGTIWPLRLLLPVPAALFSWWVLWLFGL